MSDDLAAWLTQIWDEQEKAANEATEGPWRYWLAPREQAPGLRFGIVEAGYIEGDLSACSTEVAAGYTTDPDAPLDQQYDASELNPADARHIAANNPAVVLARITAARAILVLHKPQWNDTADIAADFYGCLTCGESDLCDTVKLLSSPYADLPGYREDWKP